MFRAPRTKQQVKLFVEQRLVLGAWPTKENEGFGEGAATGHDLRAALRQEVQGGELLIDTDRIVRTQHHAFHCSSEWRLSGRRTAARTRAGEETA